MNETNPRPLANSYWVEPGRFLAGEYPGHFDQEQTRKRLDALLEAGLDTFIDLTLAREVVPYAPILEEEARIYQVETVYERFPVGDFGLPTPDQMNALLGRIEDRLHGGHSVYLHCRAGIGRTGTTVGCYLVRQGAQAQAALAQLSRWWQQVPRSQIHPHSPETGEQVNFVRSWAGHDEKRRANGR